MGFTILWWRHLLLVFACYVLSASASALAPRTYKDASSTCNLNVQSNDGGRKVAVLIDSSSSMYLTDPQNARLDAADLLADWLVSDAEAKTMAITADEVAVIAFNETAHLEYALGDPAEAISAIDGIRALGGTDVAGGLQLGIQELMKSGSGTTSGRSSMIVFTDGEDYDTQSLVSAIQNATSYGIRVSFGFMNTNPNSLYDISILSAIAKSGGVYATITASNSSSNFINYCILNGLTNDDNPSGNPNQLLPGLSTIHFISGTTTAANITYNSQVNDWVQFTITSISAGNLSASASYNGKIMNTTITGPNSTLPGGMLVITPQAGQINITISSTAAGNQSIYLVSATSNHAISNCTVGVLDEVPAGWPKAEKYGIFVGVPVGVVALAILLTATCIMSKSSSTRKKNGTEGQGQGSARRGDTTPPILADGYGFLSRMEKEKFIGEKTGGIVELKEQFSPPSQASIGSETPLKIPELAFSGNGRVAWEDKEEK